MDAILGHGLRKFPTAGLLATSAGRGWTGIAAELRSHSAGEIPPIQSQQMELTLSLAGNGMGSVHRRGNGNLQETRVRPGVMWLCPVGVFEDSIFISDTIERVAHLYLPASAFAALATELSGAAMQPSSVEYLAGIADPLLEQMARAICHELAQETTGGRVLVDALALSIIARIAQSYGGGARPAKVRVGAIDGIRLRRVLECIAAEIETDLSVERLADIACLSRFHFSRAFKKAMGIAPHHYIAQKRFAHAQSLLTQTNRSLADVAMACGFSSQANFSRAFARSAGTSPGRFRAMAAAV